MNDGVAREHRLVGPALKHPVVGIDTVADEQQAMHVLGVGMNVPHQVPTTAAVKPVVADDVGPDAGAQGLVAVATWNEHALCRPPHVDGMREERGAATLNVETAPDDPAWC